MVRYTALRDITDKEKNRLYSLLDTNQEIKYRIKIVLLASEGYTVPEIREMTNIYDRTIRKWIHKFNDNGIEALFTKIDYSPMVKIDNDDARKQIIKIASTNPRDLGLKFSTWSLRSLAAGYLTRDKKIVKQGISHTRIKEILNESKIEWRNSKTVLGKNRDPEYELKKIGLKN
ncbi:MAG TPA: helix-turn-helix domain-containing protein [Nitrososphaeraceae archaeon]|nr:helix-turn-helix domain-containing protein [Nitrososphaeraceae archaeon]